MLNVSQANAILANRLTAVGRVDNVYEAIQEFRKDFPSSDQQFCRFAYLLSLEFAYDPVVKWT